jgi:thioredoxin 1
MNRSSRLMGIAALLTLLAVFTVAAQETGKGAPPMMMMSSGGKVDFTSLEDARTRAAKGPTVLLFAADWCPTCQAALKDITSREASLGDVSVLVVDYDRRGDLKRMYGVTYQHTFVQIDAKGGKTVVWSGGGVDEILRRVMRGM